MKSGIGSSEFLVVLACIIGYVALVIFDHATEAYGLIGFAAPYVAGRSWVKGKQAQNGGDEASRSGL